MKIQPSLATVSRRDRLGSWLREHRLAALAEIMIVIAIYVLKINGFLPMSKIPILLFGTLSLWLRGIGWRKVGLRKPDNWTKTIFIGVGIACLDTLVGWFAVLPLLHKITGETMDLWQLDSIRGSIGELIFWLALSWPYAAIAEEMVYRGYLLNRLADLFGHSKSGWILSVVLSSLMFGVVHGSMGLTGVLNTFLSGILYAGAYLVFGRNIWIPIIIHGFGNMIGLVMLYFGIYP